MPLKACDLFNKVFIIVGMVIALHFGYGVYALVTVNAIAGLIIILFKLIIINRGTDIKINWKYFDKDSLKDIFGFSVWTTVGSIAQRLIFNITPSIITAVSVTGSVGVAIFGLATTVEVRLYIFYCDKRYVYAANFKDYFRRQKRRRAYAPYDKNRQNSNNDSRTFNCGLYFFGKIVYNRYLE